MRLEVNISKKLGVINITSNDMKSESSVSDFMKKELI